MRQWDMWHGRLCLNFSITFLYFDAVVLLYRQGSAIPMWPKALAKIVGHLPGARWQAGQGFLSTHSDCLSFDRGATKYLYSVESTRLVFGNKNVSVFGSRWNFVRLIYFGICWILLWWSPKGKCVTHTMFMKFLSKLWSNSQIWSSCNWCHIPR